jgi:predicted tellurium resistance membrane protein TerC
MTDLINGDVLTTLAQVIMIDLVLAGDNAVVIGLAAAGLPDKQRKRAILIGIVIATVLRIVGATIATQLLQVLGLSPGAFFSCGSAGRCGASFT